MKISLKDASPGDFHRIAEILITSRIHHLPYAPSPHTEEETECWVKNVLFQSGDVTLALSDNEIVGVLAVNESAGVGWIDQMYIAPDFVGLGIGSTLMKHALEVLPRPIRLYTFQQNQGARRFYERYGFKAISFRNGEENEECCPDVLYELLD
ncbi:MAG: GNAT family N-acetyltransferase [Pseudomonadota bacterium]